MNIDFYYFRKKKNSTAQPSTTTYTTYDCQLKDGCSIRSPEIILRKSDFDISWNYVHIAAFDDRYYFIDDVILEGNMITIMCVEDDLASNKGSILNTMAYIEYCRDSTEVYIPDTRLTYDAVAVPAVVHADTYYMSSTEYCYLITCIGVNNDYTPDIITPYTLSYLTSGSGLLNIASSLFTNLSGNVIDDLAKYFSDAANCIVKINRLPMNYARLAGNKIARPIYLGKYKLRAGVSPDEFDVTGFPFNDTSLSESIEITIPWQSDDFRRCEPYTTLRLFLPFVGVVGLSTNDFIYTSKILIDITYSLTNRQVNYAIKSTSSTIIAMYSGQMGYTVPTSSYNANIGGAISAVVGGGISLAGAVASGSTSAIVGTALSTANNLSSAIRHTASMSGDFNGSAMEKFGVRPTLIAMLNDTIAPPASYAVTNGRPFCRVDAISNHSGYVQTVGFSINSALLDGEADSINSLMNSGVYIE